ncbi:MAG: hypothetical protein BRD39_02730 [Bacteroidetes bacterium QH_9_64_21]|nr:MAG: hypothetical protein BRD39_02730 [Bacteroidetes bacterium QH_9_64_21]
MPDPEPITPLLAERLDISPDRTEALLQSMLQELKNRAASEGVHLSDLGTFQDEDGTLAFIPSPSLRRRVNHQFEGLSPEDLAGPPAAQPEADAPPSLRESSEEDDTSPTEPQSPDDKSSSTTGPDEEDTPALDPMDEDGDDEPTETPDQPVDPGFEDVPTEPAAPEPGGVSDEDEESAEPSIPTLDPIEDEDDGDESEMPPPGDADEPGGTIEEASPEEDEEEEEVAGPLGSFSVIGSLLVLVVLVGIGWLVFSETDLWSSSQPAYENSDPETTQTADSEGPNQSSDPEASEDASGDDQPERHAGIPPGDDSGDAADMQTGTWTIVVASLSSRPNAEATAAKYEDRFNSAEVMPATVDNRTRYRVAVGRYDSEAAAERALDANRSTMPSGAWIHELR